MQVKINNWDKYNPRKDLKSLSWIRLDGDIGFSESLFGLTVSTKWLWVFILSYSSKKNSGEFSIDRAYLCHHSGVSECEIDQAISALCEKGLIGIISNTSRSRTDSIAVDTEPTENVPYERTNITNITNDTDIASESEIKRIKPNEVRNLFDEMLGGKGRIKKVPGHAFPSSLTSDFINITGNIEFNSIEKWREYFTLVAQSDWLLNKFNTTLSWLLKPDNAFKVFEGQYENNLDSGKAAKQAHSDSGAKAEQLFERIIRTGRYEFAKSLKPQLTAIELKAIENLGGLAPIFDCDNFTQEKVKAQLRAAYKQALEIAT